MLSTSQGRPPLLFIAPRAKLAVAPSLGKTRGHRTLTGSHRTLNPQHPVLTRHPRVTSRLNSTIAANGYCARAPAQYHRTLYYVTPDPCAESSTNSQGHRTRATGRTLSVRCSPDSCAERVAKPPAHRTLSTGLTLVRPVHSAHLRHRLTPHRTLWTSVRCCQHQRPVARNTPATSPKFPTGAIENMHLIFSKASNPTSQARREGERNPNPSQP